METDVTRRPSTGGKVALLMAGSLTVMAGTVVSPVLPAIHEVFASLPNVELLAKLVLTLHALAVVLTAAGLGFVADRWGRKPLLLAGLVIYALGGASGLVLNDLHGVLAGRLVLGLGVAGVSTAATTLIADYYSGAERSRFMGLQAAFMAGAGFVFLVSAGALADFNWHAPFAIYLVALLIVPAAALLLPEPVRGGSGRGAGAEAPRTRWALTGLLLFMAVLGMMLFYAVPVQAPFLLKARLGATGLHVGVALGIVCSCAAITSLFFHRIWHVLGFKGTLALMFLAEAVGFFGLAHARSYLAVVPALCALGPGFGLLIPNLSTWMAGLVEARHRGRMLGLLTTCLFLGQFLSPLVSHPVLRWGGLTGWSGVFGVNGFVALGFGLLAVLWALTGRRDTT